MIRLSVRIRELIIVISVAVISVFSNITLLTMTALALGTIAITLGISYSYRPASIVGLLTIYMAAASAMEIPTLMETSMVITAILGMLIPVVLLGLLALSFEDEENDSIVVPKRPLAISLFYGAVCVMAAPLVSLAISLVAPTFALNVNIVSQMALVFIAAVLGGMYLARTKPPAAHSPSPEREESAEA
ncbi:MAG: hypothetical protein MUC90_07360 [Thermoplasmata archaeon]|nr:hypothetical protein [Thermoplasmata archaeon]